MTYPLHPESSTAIHHLEEVLVLLTPEPAESSDLKVRPEMAHVVLLPFHCLEVDIWNGDMVWVASQDLFRQRVLEIWILFWNVLGWIWLRFDKHLPQTLGGQIIYSFVC